ncbi:hypothetical protein [Desulfofundulus kuznetsovii]|uniref:hypothetical protein n=1 Tax=Desulfofundulus kuznetsovii TaxID=58135 RepID=UPI00338E18D1
MVILFSIFIFTHTSAAFADYYQASTGNGQTSVRMSFSGKGSYVFAQYLYGPNPNPCYVPGNMGAGRIVFRFTVTDRSISSSWNYATVVRIPLYLIDTNGVESYWMTIEFQPWNFGVGTEVVLGDFFIGQNYRGIRFGTPAAYCPYYNSGYADVTGTFKLEYYAIIFAQTETQFNNLYNNVINASNLANAAN